MFFFLRLRLFMLYSVPDLMVPAIKLDIIKYTLKRVPYYIFGPYFSVIKFYTYSTVHKRHLQITDLYYDVRKYE